MKPASSSSSSFKQEDRLAEEKRRGGGPRRHPMALRVDASLTNNKKSSSTWSWLTKLFKSGDKKNKDVGANSTHHQQQQQQQLQPDSPTSRSISQRGNISWSWRETSGSNRATGPSLASLLDINTEDESASSSDLLNCVILQALPYVKPGKFRDIPQRVAHVTELAELVRKYRIDHVNLLWQAVADLLDAETMSLESQHAGLQMMCACIEGQLDRLNVLRFQFFTLIKTGKPHSGPDPNWGMRVKALSLLTKRGRRVVPFANEVGDLMVEWLDELRELAPNVQRALKRRRELPLSPAAPTPLELRTASRDELRLKRRSMDELTTEVVEVDEHELRHAKSQRIFTNFLHNFVRYNFASVDADMIVLLLDKMCSRCQESSVFTAQFGMPFFDCMVRYAVLPRTSVSSVTAALCQVVNGYSKESWNIMKRLLDSSRGFEAVNCLFALLDHVTAKTVMLARGAVFFLGMSSWGSQRVVSLDCPFSVILPHLHAALVCGDIVVIYEVLLSVRRLIKKYGSSLLAEWGAIFSILEACHEHCLVHMEHAQSNVIPIVQDTIENIVDLYETGELFASDERTMRVLTMYMELMVTDRALFCVFDYTLLQIHPSLPDWLATLDEFILRFFHEKQDNATIQVRCLRALEERLRPFRGIYAEDIVSRGILPCCRLAFASPLPAKPRVRAHVLRLTLRVAPTLTSLPLFQAFFDLLSSQLAAAMTTTIPETSDVPLPVAAEEEEEKSSAGESEDADSVLDSSVSSEMKDEELVHVAMQVLEGLLERTFLIAPCTKVLSVIRFLSSLATSHANPFIRRRSIAALCRLSVTHTGAVSLHPRKLCRRLAQCFNTEIDVGSSSRSNSPMPSDEHTTESNAETEEENAQGAVDDKTREDNDETRQKDEPHQDNQLETEWGEEQTNIDWTHTHTSHYLFASSSLASVSSSASPSAPSSPSSSVHNAIEEEARAFLTATTTMPATETHNNNNNNNNNTLDVCALCDVLFCAVQFEPDPVVFRMLLHGWVLFMDSYFVVATWPGVTNFTRWLARRLRTRPFLTGETCQLTSTRRSASATSELSCGPKHKRHNRHSSVQSLDSDVSEPLSELQEHTLYAQTHEQGEHNSTLSSLLASKNNNSALFYNNTSNSSNNNNSSSSGGGGGGDRENDTLSYFSNLEVGFVLLHYLVAHKDRIDPLGRKELVHAFVLGVAIDVRHVGRPIVRRTRQYGVGSGGLMSSDDTINESLSAHCSPRSSTLSSGAGTNHLPPDSCQRQFTICLIGLGKCLAELTEELSSYLIRTLKSLAHVTKTAKARLRWGYVAATVQFLHNLSNFYVRKHGEEMSYHGFHKNLDGPHSDRLSFSINSEHIETIFSMLLPLTDSSNELVPSYVISLVYRCLTGWFFKLNGSRNATLTRHLSSVAGTLNQHIETHNCVWARTLLDLMARLAYEDPSRSMCDDIDWKPAPAYLFGSDVTLVCWSRGCTLTTLRAGHLGYAEVTVRRPTGTTGWLMKLKNRVQGDNLHPSLHLPLSSLSQYQAHLPSPISQHAEDVISPSTSSLIVAPSPAFSSRSNLASLHQPLQLGPRKYLGEGGRRQIDQEDEDQRVSSAAVPIAAVNAEISLQGEQNVHYDYSHSLLVKGTPIYHKNFVFPSSLVDMPTMLPPPPRVATIQEHNHVRRPALMPVRTIPMSGDAEEEEEEEEEEEKLNTSGTEGSTTDGSKKPVRRNRRPPEDEMFQFSPHMRSTNFHEDDELRVRLGRHGSVPSATCDDSHFADDSHLFPSDQKIKPLLSYDGNEVNSPAIFTMPHSNSTLMKGTRRPSLPTSFALDSAVTLGSDGEEEAPLQPYQFSMAQLAATRTAIMSPVGFQIGKPPRQRRKKKKGERLAAAATATATASVTSVVTEAARATVVEKPTKKQEEEEDMAEVIGGVEEKHRDVGSMGLSAAEVMQCMEYPGVGAVERTKVQHISLSSIQHMPRVNPAFMYLQMMDCEELRQGGARIISNNGDDTEQIRRALSVLDRIHVKETLKVGVVYVGKAQEHNEVEILSNRGGSLAYHRFLARMGRVAPLRAAKFFSGGLDTKEDLDGTHALVYEEKHIAICYHVATMMPQRVKYPRFGNKKRFIGNDLVCIVFNDSGKPYDPRCMCGQPNFVHIVISPCDTMYRVEVLVSKSMAGVSIGPLAPTMVHLLSGEGLSWLVKETVVHANDAVQHAVDALGTSAEKHNWHLRMEQIIRLSDRIKTAPPSSQAFNLDAFAC